MSKIDGKQLKKILFKNVAAVLIAAAVLVVVWIVAHAAVGNDLLLPDFFDCMRQVGVLLKDGGFWLAFWHTLSRVLIAFVFSFALALIFALIAYMVPWFCRILSPAVSMLRSLPTLAVLLIVLVWAGAAKAPIVVAFMTLFPSLYAGILAALSQVDGELLEMSRVYKVSMKKRVLQLYIPSAAPYVLREAGAALAFALKLIVSAEVLANTWKSLGGLMQEAKLFYEMPTLFALVVLTFVVGLALEILGAITAFFVERRVK
ncbi:MAG: ABC transporter permease subunit [Clostridia bacterium]|nr:ABC transporter permease subunit [Clostridia bacterium]